MNIIRIFPVILILIILFVIICLSGCVEVTPPTGQQEAQAYGPVSQGNGEMKDLVKAYNQTGTSAGQSHIATQGPAPEQGSASPSDTSAPETVLPPAENETFVKVTPKDYNQLKPDTQTSYLPYNRPIATDNRQFVTIYEILNQTFVKNASAYAYHLVTPPLYIELGFYPKMVTDEQEVYKRTGDKEGTIKFTKTRPSQDAWFEMRVYDMNTNQEIIREGYGKTYSLTNKTAAIRRAGTFQFDFMGDNIAADIAMKIPIDNSTVNEYSNVSTLIQDQKVKSGLLPSVFIQESDIGQGWQKTGDLIHTPVKYSSIFILPSSGLKITQEIHKFPGAQDAVSYYSQTKTKNAGETLVAITAGDEGYGFESVLKTGVVFRQGAYLVELTSYSVPPVTLDELKRLATLISGRISQI
ncbi:MAG TPA: hypothetical protein PK024_05985 [Methanospirillum sp.]|uniref:hypothetical protein n=1 Tax=Methanospirillum sp. TaxID=45200 RepID=UPI002C218567|nr:hypothetical protein [Methanospirillum sp.]HOJ96372.1 hypothetical protein [Methanospirillum sp.]HOL41034.1 hypothetical protein [Methanospirillum sp.]HPP77100.1 hypothetical protein [Methanospirillum sp.]